MVDFSKLTDTELREGIAANSEAMAEIARQQAVIAGRHAGGSDPKTRAELVAAHDRTWAKLKLEYDAYSAELERRSQS